MLGADVCDYALQFTGTISAELKGIQRPFQCTLDSTTVVFLRPMGQPRKG